MKFFVTGSRRGLGKALAEKYGNCASLEECDIFINCKHDGFSQVELLYDAAALGKRIINISSNSGDGNKPKPHIYAVEKAALDKANEQLYYQGVNTTSVRFGWFDSPRVAHVDAYKMSLDYCVNVIDWILQQPHRVKDITITPDQGDKK
jgi:NAD(P)-dependent dehydrogenase (short-subunit alcohol dehydrogenase family)